MVEIAVVPKKDFETHVEPLSGHEMICVSVVVKFDTHQIWKAKKSGKYWFLKGRGDLKIRLTESAMNRMFNPV